MTSPPVPAAAPSRPILYLSAESFDSLLTRNKGVLDYPAFPGSPVSSALGPPMTSESCMAANLFTCSFKPLLVSVHWKSSLMVSILLSVPPLCCSRQHLQPPLLAHMPMGTWLQQYRLHHMCTLSLISIKDWHWIRYKTTNWRQTLITKYYVC